MDGYDSWRLIWLNVLAYQPQLAKNNDWGMVKKKTSLYWDNLLRHQPWQYEERSKDINKAAGATLRSLAQVLSCRIEDILEYW